MIIQFHIIMPHKILAKAFGCNAEDFGTVLNLISEFISGKNCEFL
ncbi:hypothetical protein B4135_0438 [Caldibacillus debilis]|uniref:Uncharacterized protein n=1 Tax=Caldibacillus debilis TaxID=301148 RepID=A0A150L9T1_9BACI|nr:hypothetical protein B4135_0438 [Caldibacillus debilis]